VEKMGEKEKEEDNSPTALSSMICCALAFTSAMLFVADKPKKPLRKLNGMMGNELRDRLCGRTVVVAFVVDVDVVVVKKWSVCGCIT
jgi:hypothetical protein